MATAADERPDGKAVKAPAVFVPADVPQLGVVLVNWNGGDVTIECLESLLRSDLPIRVAVVDNGSEDGTTEKLIAWASGATPYQMPDGPLGHLTDLPLEKPVPLAVISGAAALESDPGDARLVLIETGENLGFAGGNNVGMRHLFRDPNIEAVWLLNNDTVVEPGAARALLATMKSDRRMGMAGTVVRYYHRPEVVQVLNGMQFNIWTGQASGIGGNQPVSRRINPSTITRKTDFILGASLAVSRRFVEEVGLMSERYFLYYEEIDWATRNRGRFRLGFARGATVFHKHGGAIGSSSVKGGRSAMSDYWMLRSRLKFYRAHYPALLPLIWVQGLAQTAMRAVRRQPHKAGVMLKALFGRDL